ncbi:acyltransferase family protein [Microbacterium aurantiacum]|uniref:acyltransferase family protein n=1 Tax=Microbacterium aurantiacum TaxID=162393 RepID=UPI00341776C0
MTTLAPVRRRRDSPTSAFRSDIQALRALAVGAVLVYHLWPDLLTGGFVGVDVFFVISGFLITTHLLSEVARTRRIDVPRFWARRAKRLLPAALIVLAASTISTLIWVPRSLWDQFLGEVVASTLYVQNWFLATASVDYSGADNTASPVQHFWTLSVEEQFYFALPLLLLAVIGIAPRRDHRTAVWLTIGLVTFASFVYSVWYTEWSAASAYFSTFTRVWEFGVGALIGALRPLRNRAAPGWIALFGLVLIGFAAVTFNPTVPYPGAAALLPVVGTAMILWVGSRTFVSRIGGLRSVAFLGRVSYGAYLWHWPLIVLAPHCLGRPIGDIDKVAILALTLVLAWASTQWIEDRVRFSPRLLGSARPRTTAAWSVIGMAVVLSIASAGLVSNAAAEAKAETTAEAILASDPPCFGAAALAEDCDNPDLRDTVIPAVPNAAGDDSNRADCWSRGDDGDVRICSLGPASGYDRHILAVGDSHNNTLIAAYERIAAERNWRIDVAGRAGCYWTEATLTQPTQELETACEQWREEMSAHVRVAEDLDAILVTKGRRDFADEVRSPVGASPETTVVGGMVDAWANRAVDSIPILAVVDNPFLGDVIGCVEEDPTTADVRCAAPRSRALSPADGIAEAATLDPNATVIDLTSLYCDTTSCSPVVGGALVYRDDRGHLTATYARTVAPYLGEAIARVIE